MQEEIAFNDWQAEAEQMQETSIAVGIKCQQHIQQVENKNQQQSKQIKIIQLKDYEQSCLNLIKQYKGMSNQHFEQQFKQRLFQFHPYKKTQGCDHYLKSQKDFVDLAKLVSQKLLKEVQTQEDVLSQNNLIIFFQEMLLYLYIQINWRHIEGAKEKIKALKKSRKENENRAKKIKQKQQRWKRTHKVIEGQEETKKEQQKPIIQNKITENYDDYQLQTL